MFKKLPQKTSLDSWLAGCNLMAF